MLDRISYETLPKTDRGQRLLPDLPARANRWLFALVLVLCLAAHIGLVTLFLTRGEGELPVVQEEVPVEVIVEPPPPPAEPPPEQPKPQDKPKQEPPKPKYEQDLKPAFDAPRAPNEEKVEREAPEKETQAPQPSPQQAPEPPAEQQAQPDTPKIADTPAPAHQEQATQPMPDEDKPDAEALNKALQQKDDKVKSNSEAARTKKTLPVNDKAALAKQLAAMKPLPDFTLGAKSKPAPVTGGTENTTYLSVLFGIIMKHMNNPEATRQSPGTAVIFFALDDNGNLVHQAVERTSGFPDIDAETMAAVRRSAPFPPPPRDMPHRFFFSRDIERGR
jgi:protein TonB